MNCTVTIILQELHHTQICWIIDCMHYNPSTGQSTSFSRVPSESEPHSVSLFMRWDQAVESPLWRGSINRIHQALYHSQPQVPTTGTLCINYKHQNLLLFSLFPQIKNSLVALLTTFVDITITYNFNLDLILVTCPRFTVSRLISLSRVVVQMKWPVCPESYNLSHWLIPHKLPHDIQPYKDSCDGLLNQWNNLWLLRSPSIPANEIPSSTQKSHRSLSPAYKNLPQASSTADWGVKQTRDMLIQEPSAGISYRPIQPMNN